MLSGSNSARPTFVADKGGTYSISLVVSDGTTPSASASVSVIASTANVAPVANAGPSQNVLTGTTVTLNGSGSTDANGDSLTYLWTISSKPAGSTVGGSTNAQTASFVPDVDGVYTASLVVNDGTVSSSPSLVTITAASANVAPVASAGANQTVFTNAVVTLNGAGSSDANGNPLAYLWVLISQPAGSGVVPLSSPSSVTTTLVPPVVGTYVVALLVSAPATASTENV